MTWLRRIAIAAAALVALLAAALAVVDTQPGHRWVADRIAGVKTANGLRFAVGRIDGSLYGRAQLHDVRVYDLDGLLFRAPAVTLDWRPWEWFADRLAIRALLIDEATLFHAPRTRPSRKGGPILPDFDIAIGRLAVGRLVLARPVLGSERVAQLTGRADIRRGRALVDVAALVAGSDRLRFRIDAEPARDRFDVRVAGAGRGDGVLARLAGVRAPVRIEVEGAGSWARWRGRADARVGTTRAIDLTLGADAGRYTLAGTLTPAPLVRGKLQRLTAPRVLVNGDARFADRRLEGALSLRSASLAADVTGTIDLATSRYRNVRVAARLLRPAALFPNMTGRNVALRALIDGPFANAAFDYRLAANRFAFDDTGFEQARAAGRGRLSAAPVRLPVRFTAARVTGVGTVAGGILRNLSVAGTLLIDARHVVGNDLRLASDKLAGRIGLTLDLATGRYEVGLSGGLRRYLIPGLGVVDVQTRLQVVPGAGGRGTRVVGRGEARVLRLDNGFFRSLAGGLPRITTGLERGADGVLHFRGLVLTGPQIRLAGNGYRRRDGSFHFEGAGAQARYGPVRLVLDGDIARPTVDLILARPNAALGLNEVRAHLDPVANGFAFRAAGGSRLGAFTGSGTILLPSGADAQIAVDRLDVAGTRATGTIAIADTGFDGTLNVAGGGVSGTIVLRPDAGVQRVEAHLVARNATFAGAALRSGRLDATIRLAEATTVDATATGQGLRRGSLSLARFAGTAQLSDGAGTVRASIAGSRGRAFDIQTVTEVAADRYRISAQGTLDRRPLALLTPAVLAREADGWRLAPTRLSFGGGEAQVAGRFSDEETTVDASLTAMPLALLDIGYPGLGLGGSASGKLSVALRDGASPTGRVEMTVRGLTRSGLVLSSRAVDVGVAGVLTADRLAVRVVAASGGRTIGRGQALIRPLAGGGDPIRRIAQAPLFAQLRYAGPADTLWRLTGVELFDLSGPVAIGADVRGRLAAPAIAGTIRADGARIESATTGTTLTNVQATGRFAGSELRIDRFAADAGKGGRVSGTGRFDFAAAKGIGLDLQLQADRAVMIARDDIGATVTGPLVFRSDGSGGTISGDVVLNRSRYRLGQATAATAVPRIAVREINLPDDGGADGDAPAAPWTLAIHARAPGQVIVGGLGLTSEWSADVRIAGQPTNPAITGTARLVRGDYEFAGREFELARGVIRFGGEMPANPALDIEANANTTGLNAAIRVTGTALKPEIGFTSTPALPQDELLSRLLFGTSITNLSAPEALQLAAAVAALQGGDGGLNPINAVRRAAGLDRLRILPADPQTGQGTSIAAGKYVTRRLYAEIVTDGQGYSATRVEFQVTRWLSLLSSISTLGRQSANVRVSRDF